MSTKNAHLSRLICGDEASISRVLNSSPFLPFFDRSTKIDIVFHEITAHLDWSAFRFFGSWRTMSCASYIPKILILQLPWYQWSRLLAHH